MTFFSVILSSVTKVARVEITSGNILNNNLFSLLRVAAQMAITILIKNIIKVSWNYVNNHRKEKEKEKEEKGKLLVCFLHWFF